MSIKLMDKVWELQSLSQPRKMLLLSIADYASDEGIAWPAVKTLMRKCSLKSESGTRRAINELVELGWLTKQERPRKERKGKHQQDTNLYQINLVKLYEEAAIYEPVPRAPSKQRKSEPVHCDGSHGDGSYHEGSCDVKKGDYEPVPRTPDPSLNSKHDPSDKNTIGQPPAAATQDEGISEEIHITDQAILVLKHLNLLTGAKYTTAKSTLENIRARLVDGHSLDELKLVVEYLVDRWLGTEWAKYLNPETMFRPGKFPGNLLAATAWHDGGRKPEQVRTPVNNTDRDAAYRRFIGSSLPLQNPGDLEQLVRTEASNAGVRGMQPSYSVNAWNRIWADCEHRVNGGKAA